VLNSLLEPDSQRVAVGGSAAFVASTADLIRRGGGEPVSTDQVDAGITLMVVPLIDPVTGTLASVQELAAACHARNVRLIVEATGGLGACELLVDDWGIDVCVAGVDHAIGAPPGMSLVTYSDEVQRQMVSRALPPRTSYLDLVQVQAYWSSERLNHHTAPTSLLYALREALRLVQLEGLSERWARHSHVGGALRDGVRKLGARDLEGDLPYTIVHLPRSVDEGAARQRLLDEFGVYVSRVGPRTWRMGLLGEDARSDVVQRVVTALEKVLAA